MEERVRKLNDLVLRTKKCFRILPIGELTLNEISALIEIDEKIKVSGAVTMGEVGELLDLRKSNVSQLVSRLERKGMLKRENVFMDRRKTQVGLTEKGKKLVDTLERERIKVIEGAVNILGEAKADEFTELFEQYICAIEGGNGVTTYRH